MHQVFHSDSPRQTASRKMHQSGSAGDPEEKESHYGGQEDHADDRCGSDGLAELD